VWLHDVAGKRPGGFPLGMPEEAMHRLAEPAYAASMRDAQQTLDRELGGQRRDVSRPRT
jgi:hypothetical protein